MDDAYSLRQLVNSDIEQIVTIEQQAHSYPWSRDQLLELNGKRSSHYGLFDADEVLLGYFYSQNIVGEVSLLNIAVAPQKQGQGLGKYLLQQLIAISEQAKAESIWLEVRESNQGAIALYQKLGFNEVDRRRDYYPATNGREDALLMSYIL